MSEETNTAQIVLYQSEGANVPVEVSYMQGTFWMPQRRIAELFGKDKSTISRHLKNIFGEGELDRDSVVANIATTAADGKSWRRGNQATGRASCHFAEVGKMVVHLGRERKNAPTP